MLTIYHLEASRSGRIIWLAEELGLEYKLETFKRTSQRMAPPEYKALHPLGRSPVIRDGELVLAESGAIVEYLLARYGRGRLVPDVNSPDYAQYLFWLHFAEGTLMAHFIGVYLLDAAGVKDHAMRQGIVANFAKDLGFAEDVLAKQPFLAGKHFTGADIVMSYGLTAARHFRDSLPPYPHIESYAAKLAERPAFKKAQSFG
jgi:glutathione S-transferase